MFVCGVKMTKKVSARRYDIGVKGQYQTNLKSAQAHPPPPPPVT